MSEERKVKWTDDQQNAIDSRGAVLISAAAGSGKTAVLAEHVIGLITGESAIDVDRLLVLTFTRDAAAEMKGRIRKILDKRIAQEGATAAILRQKQKLYTAKISTTDSFCSSLVREHFSVLGIAPDFRIAGGDEIAAVSEKALDLAITPFYAANSPDFRRLLRAFASGNTDSGLRHIVTTLHAFLQNQPFRRQWLDEMVRRYADMPFTETEWAAELLKVIPNQIDELLTKITESVDEAAALPAVLSNDLLPVLEEDGRNLNVVKRALLTDGYEGLCREINSRFEQHYTVTPSFDAKALKGKKTVYNRITACRLSVRQSLQDYCGAEDELKNLSGLMVTLSELVVAYDRELTAIKDRRNIRTFSDVSLLTVQLLAEACRQEEAEFCTGGFYYRRTPLAKELSERFYQVIVDEYQDVNLIQEVIYNCISQQGENLFMVGDVKQSIYGFRQSKAKLFSDRKNRYSTYDAAQPTYPATIYLSKNFRSCQQVCETVNFMFSRLMPDYTPEEYLNFGADGYTYDEKRNTEIVLIAKEQFDDAYSTTALEARYTAGRILRMMEEGCTVTENGVERPLQFGDIAVLMRAKSGSDSEEEAKQKGSAEFVRQLAKYGIPAYCEESENFLAAQEVKLLMNLLRVIDNPSDDVALLSVLLSPVFGFTPDDLTIIRLNQRRASLYHSLNICREDDTPTGRRANQFLKELRRLRNLASVSTVDELLEEIYERTALIAVTAAVNGGTASKNLDLMRVYARKFAANGYKTLSDFNTYLDRLIKSGKQLAAASRTKGVADCVQVMSIHKSKGLEFPVCFLADTARSFNEMDFHSPILMDSDAYVGIKPYVNYVRTSTFPYRAITLKKKRESLDEEMRMLYVALTRAKEKLIILGTVEKPEEKVLPAIAEKTADGEIRQEEVYRCKRLLDWVLMTAAVNPSTRALIDENRAAGECEANWQLHKVLTEDELFPVQTKAPESEEEAPQEEVPDYAAILQSHLSFEYPDADIIGVPQKVNPSQVSHSENHQFSGKALVVPAFAKNNQKLSPTEIGTAHHEFLHYCDFNAALDDLEAEINRLQSAEKLTERQCGCLDRDKLAAILRNPLFERMIKQLPDNVFREKQFTVFVHPSFTCEGEFKSDRRQIVDGEVDAVFIEDGELVIVDYKTDRVKEVAELRRHKPQLDLYEEAMKQVLGLPVKEKIVFSITLNQYITV